MKYKINIVEDEKDLQAVAKSYLEREGYEVTTFDDGNQAMEAIGTGPHLWILDIMLPGMDGFELLKYIKEKNSHTPVIFVSARNQDFDRILGLEMGSDDYLTKPYSPRELVIRTKRILERVYGNTDSENLQYQTYKIDITRRSVTEKNNEIDLTAKEFDLLEFFITHKGQALSREQIIHAVWDNTYFGSDRVVDDLLRRLRKKMPALDIETIYGFGYRLK
ncbi:response regulator transcription factor [Culicoidibacter larvae]|uniref:Response regulator transcription factor n=1 Tax=Culicoidibacter larvae TaxID=2579976 RepID=A0A5R8QI95_9FIRM|nr:response regulator transcription factor [Culicoidibacter larvae]